MDDGVRRSLASELAAVIADELAAQEGMGRTQEQLAVLLADRLLDGFDICPEPRARDGRDS